MGMNYNNINKHELSVNNNLIVPWATLKDLFFSTVANF